MATSGLLAILMERRAEFFRYLRLRGASEMEAEDILQEMAVAISTATLKPIDQPRPYLYRMATNHLLLLRRSSQRRSNREESWVDAWSGPDIEVDEQPSAEARMIAQEQIAILKKRLLELPERTRVVLWKFRVEKEPQKVIAAELGISASAVEKHLMRAYQLLKIVKSELDEENGQVRQLRDGDEQS